MDGGKTRRKAKKKNVDYELTNEGTTALQLAICLQAVKDYKEAKQKLWKNTKTGKDVLCWNKKTPKEAIKEVKRDLKSEWFSLICEIDGNEIIKRLEAEDDFKRVFPTSL